MLIVTHIPKTAGTTLRNHLLEWFGERLYQEYQLLPSARLPLWRRALVAMGSLRAKVPSGTVCIIGHNKATKYPSVFPKARHAVWLREPVDRVLSHYNYVIRHPEWVNERWHGISMDKFIEHPFMRNNQAWMLDGRPLRDFDFVGDFECFDISLQLFARQFGLPAPSLGMMLNSNPERLGSRYEVSDELRARILELNTEDQALYQEAKELFRQRMEAMAMT
jgi:hypothetical protein